jgi:hypothetical protein
MPEDKPHLLGGVLEHLIALYCVDGKRYLEQVIIVPDDCIEQGINLILEETGSGATEYAAGPHQTKAVAIPVESYSALRCFIVLEQSLVEQIEPEQVPHEVMSSLLEELFHVNFYAVVWQRYGRLCPPSASFSQQELLKIAAFLIDEYMVGRSKALIISNMYYVADDKGYNAPLRLWYGGDLIALLEKAPFKLREAFSIRKKTSSAEDAWCALLAVTNRYVFEPLTRDAAFRAAHSDSDEKCPTPTASQSRFYREHVSIHWPLIQSELEAVYDTNWGQREQALNCITGNLKAFLEHFESGLQ